MRRIYWVIIIILVITNIVVINNLTIAKRNLLHCQYVLSQTKQVRDANSDYINILKENAFHLMNINNKNLKDFIVFDEENNPFRLTDLIKMKIPLLVFRIHESNCHSCLLKYLDQLSRYLYQKQDIHFILLASFSDKASFFESFRDYKFSTFFTSDSLSISFDLKESPYFFILNNSLNIQNVFIPTEHDPINIENYLNTVLE